METKEINIAALLKDCPKGTKLYSPLCGVCYYDGESDVAKLPNIRVKAFDGSRFVLNVYGRGVTYPDGECLLFPSKENRDWSTFNAPQEAPQEEQPTVYVGDVVRVIHANTLVCLTGGEVRHSDFKMSAHLFQMHPSMFKVATPEEIDYWNEKKLKPAHLHYSKRERKLIHWFLPFDKIVARTHDEAKGTWDIDFFGYCKMEGSFVVYIGAGGSDYDECLPYKEKTAKLIGTTDDYEED